MAEEQKQAQETPAPKKPVLTYPLDLREHPEREVVRFTIKDRTELEEKKSIYLYTPPGLSVPDGASYGTMDLGMMGAAADKFEQNKQEGQGNLEALSNITTQADLVAAIQSKAGNMGGALGGAIGKAAFKQGVAANPYTVANFQGVTQRNFSFTFKLVAQSEKEALEIKAIENTFRKFLYPKLAKSPILFKYPPYWQIEFLKGDKPNTHLPFINLCFLQNMTATYNTSTNVFHPDGSPVEVDISLTYIEAKNLTREDLYKDVDSYQDAEYHYDYNKQAIKGAADNMELAEGVTSGGGDAAAGEGGPE